MNSVSRYDDLYLVNSVGTGLKERPKLNLTVKKELKNLGGQIIAQSGMAKGPDAYGILGFAAGWTTRVSNCIKSIEDKVNSLDDVLQASKPKSVEEGDADVEVVRKEIQEMIV